MLRAGSNRLPAAGRGPQVTDRKFKSSQFEVCGLKRKKSFTLVEVMISAAVLSVGLMFILQGQSSLLNILRISEDNLEVTSIIENKMAQVQIAAKENPQLTFAALEDSIEVKGIKMDWGVKAEAVEETENLNRVEAVMSWKEGKRKGRIPIVTYFRKIPLPVIEAAQ